MSKTRSARVAVLTLSLMATLLVTHAAGDPPPPPAKPPYPDLPAKGAQATGLILIMHGWRGSPADWPTDLKTKITARLTAAGTQNLWDIVAYDWADIQVGGKQLGAATGINYLSYADSIKKADQARVNGLDIGTFLGEKIKGLAYTKVHFVGHSAGSWVNDRAADKVKALNGTAEMQQTFLDTFMPLNTNDDLGDTVKFAIQYVDKREYIKDQPLTNATLKHAYNLDVTGLDPKPNRKFSDDPSSHAWPHMWYRQTADDPAAEIAYTWGYNRSLENGNMPTFGAVIQGRPVNKNVRDGLPPPKPANPAKQAPVISRPDLDWRLCNQSLDGVSVEPTTGTSVTLDADVTGGEPEAWIEQTVTISESTPVNVLEFTYQFDQSPGAGQGWLIVYLDDEIVFHADERYARTFLPEPDKEARFLGENLSPGDHTLAFRLDPYSDDPNYAYTSRLAIADVSLSYAPIPTPLCAPTPEPCRTPSSGQKALLQLKDEAPNTPDTKDRVTWKWVKGAATIPADYGSPDTSDEYELCIYDNGSLLSSAKIPAGGMCGARPCWAPSTMSFKYKDNDLTPDGAQLLRLQAAPVDGHAKIIFKGKGLNLDMPPTSTIVGPVDVQLKQSGGGPCFGATYSAPFLKQNGTVFKDKAD